jgi:hypothetical protein
MARCGENQGVDAAIGLLAHRVALEPAPYPRLPPVGAVLRHEVEKLFRDRRGEVGTHGLGVSAPCRGCWFVAESLGISILYRITLRYTGKEIARLFIAFREILGILAGGVARLGRREVRPCPAKKSP